MDIIYVVSFMFTPKIEFSESCVFLKKFAQCGCSHVQNVVPCWFVEKKKWLLMDIICVFVVLCSPLKSSFVSVVFVINDSPSNVAPMSIMLLSID